MLEAKPKAHPNLKQLFASMNSFVFNNRSYLNALEERNIYERSNNDSGGNVYNNIFIFLIRTSFFKEDSKSYFLAGKSMMKSTLKIK